MLLARASGAPVHALDLGMVGEAGCRALLADAARDADLILIEGVMGLFDGTPSSADLAAAFGVPVVAVISAKSMAQTFAAIAFGNRAVPAGAAVSRRAGESCRVGPACGTAATGAARRPALAWARAGRCGHRAAGAASRPAPAERHRRSRRAARSRGRRARANGACRIAAGRCVRGTGCSGAAAACACRQADRGGARCGFSFIYPANLALLDTLGAQVRFFSPLADEPVPDDCDALFLPGGYPELHAAALAANAATARSIRAHAAAGRPIVAECGDGVSG